MIASPAFRPVLRIVLAVVVGLFALIGLAVTVLVAVTLMTDRRSPTHFAAPPDPPQPVDPTRFGLVAVGMPESQLIELLGLPLQARGPQLSPLRIPQVLNPEDCEGKIPCNCQGPVRELLYYRGTAGQSLYVYIDALGTVCCYQRTHALRTFNIDWR